MQQSNQQPGYATLDDRAVVRIAGPDATKFLQGLVTNDVARLERQPSLYAGLLTPQGKILFDFFLVRIAEGYGADVARTAAEDFLKRLGFYRLRAKVEIALTDERVLAAWNGKPNLPGISNADPRLAALGARAIVPAGPAGGNTDAYHAHRISLGVPEGGRDYRYGDLFPHEAGFDQLAGVDFDKGCYVGQEVVSRMQHRGTARSRFLIVEGMAELPPMGTEVRAGTRPLGVLGSHVEWRGLALLRLDRLADARTAGETIEAGGVPLDVTFPPWARFEAPARHETAP